MAAKKKLILMLAAILALGISSCYKGSLYERLANVPGAAWKSSFQPSFSFAITDTAARYQVYVIIRHTSNYQYNNIWVESTLQLPGDSLLTQKLDLTLASPERWLGTGMDDIFERRIQVTARPKQFNRSGNVVFTLKLAMRQDPLPGIMQVGVRVEKMN